MIRGGLLGAMVVLAGSGWCAAQQESGFQPFLGQGIYDLTGIYSQAARATAAQRVAYQAFQLTVDHLSRQFAASPEYRSAMDDLDQAHAALEAARTPILAQVAEDQHYQELVQKYQNVSVVVKEGGLSMRDLFDLATRKMQYATEMHRMEDDALSADPAVQAARSRLIETQRTAADLRERFELSLYDNPRWIAAKQAYDNAQIELAGAQGAVFGANLTVALTVDADARHTLYSAPSQFVAAGPIVPFINTGFYYGRRY